MTTDNPFIPPRAAVDDIAEAPRGVVRQQVRRLSPHQNGKVFAVMFALSSLIILVPIGLVMMAIGGQTGGAIAALPMLLAPLLYLVIGYVMTVIGCAIYNFTYKFIGGIEYEASTESV